VTCAIGCSVSEQQFYEDPISSFKKYRRMFCCLIVKLGDLKFRNMSGSSVFERGSDGILMMTFAYECDVLQNSDHFHEVSEDSLSLVASCDCNISSSSSRRRRATTTTDECE